MAVAELLRRALVTRRRRLGNRHPRVAGMVRDLAAVLAELGEADEAERARSEARDVELDPLE